MSSRSIPFKPRNEFGRGRPNGRRNNSPNASPQLLDEHRAAILRKCVAAALRGDNAAMHLCVERVSAARRSGDTSSAQTHDNQCRDFLCGQKVLQGAARGKLTLAEDQKMTNLLDEKRTAIEDYEARLQALDSSSDQTQQVSKRGLNEQPV